jgi:hypothetical protein
MSISELQESLKNKTKKKQKTEVFGTALYVTRESSYHVFRRENVVVLPASVFIYIVLNSIIN